MLHQSWPKCAAWAENYKSWEGISEWENSKLLLERIYWYKQQEGNRISLIVFIYAYLPVNNLMAKTGRSSCARTCCLKNAWRLPLIRFEPPIIPNTTPVSVSIVTGSCPLLPHELIIASCGGDNRKGPGCPQSFLAVTLRNLQRISLMFNQFNRLS